MTEEEDSTEEKLVPSLSASVFRGQMEHLRTEYRVVPASEIFDAVLRRRRGEPFPVAVTFDDDLASHPRVALPILRGLGVPATFFICGASLREPYEFWWERLQRAVDRYGTGPVSQLMAGQGDQATVTSIHDIARIIEEMTPPQRKIVATALGERLGTQVDRRGLTSDDVNALVAGGCEIGFHTLHHDALPPLGDRALHEALEAGRDNLSAVVGHDMRLIAYPHGKADQRVAEAAGRAGFRLGFTCSGRSIGVGSQPLLLGRAFPSTQSLGHFARQLVRLLEASPKPSPRRDS